MRTNGTVHHLSGTAPGRVCWQAECLLCPWPAGASRLYASKKAASMGIGRHLHIIHNLNSKQREVAEIDPQLGCS
jgi:hypothetical protein